MYSTHLRTCSRMSLVLLEFAQGAQLIPKDRTSVRRGVEATAPATTKKGNGDEKGTSMLEQARKTAITSVLAYMLDVT